jgi:glutamyl-tRNA synthetase
LGNARTYLLAWLSIRDRGGTVVLRVEDIDSPRIKKDADRQAIEDLRWLGFDWDEGPDRGGPAGPYVQTQRRKSYEAALAELRAAEMIYPCTCTRSDVADAASAPHVGQEPPPYPGACSGRKATDAARLTVPYCWRFRTSSELRSFGDRIAGTQQCSLADELGDFVVAKADGSPAYQLAVVVDDHAMGVTEVLRGDDLLPSTFRQLALYEFFGWTPPAFAHVPLVVGPDSRRLAKRHGDTRLATFRRAGCPSERIVGLLAWSCGLIPEPTDIRPAQLLAGFDLARLPKSPFVVTAKMHGRLLNSR